MQIVGVMFTAYNEGEELRRTLESVRSGTRQAHEIVVVDDGSTDGSCDAVASESVRVIRHERRVGVAASRNDACATARGEVFAFLDAHQRITPGCLEQCAEIACARQAIVWPDVRGLEDRGWTGHGARLSLCEKLPYATPWEGVWRNQALVARVCFDDRSWFEYWLPQVFGPHLTDRARAELESAEVLSEQKAFVSQKVRSDDEFFELFGGGGKATGARGSRQAGPASTPWSDEDYLLQQRRRSKPGEYKSIRPRVDAALHWMTEQIPAAALLDQRALDVGTRDGYAVEVFRRLGVAEAGGIELVPETAAYAARRGRAVRQADMRSLPDPDGWWDLVTCIHCLEHCPEPRRAVGELARVLRPGGWLFLVVPRQPSEASDPVHNCAFPHAESLRELVLGVGQFESTTLREETGVLARGRRELRLLVQRSKRNAVAASRGT